METPRPPRMLIVSPTAGLFGGTERVLELVIMEATVESNITFVFLTDGPLRELAESRGLDWKLIPRGRFRNPRDTWRTIRSLRQLISSTRAQIVLAWTDTAQLYTAPASWRICKSVWWQHSNVESGVAAMLCKHVPSKGAIANSFFVRDQLRQAGVRVACDPLYPPFEGDAFAQSFNKQQTRNRLGLPVDKYIIGSVGRMQFWKGFHTIVESIARLKAAGSECLGLIVGGVHSLEPDYEAKLRNRIQELGLTQEILLVGAQRNVPEWMACMDVFVHAAEREPFGIVVPEAMALGLPVIASIPGGPSEAIAPEESGLIVQTWNVEQLTDSLSRLMTHPDFALRLGNEAKKRSQKFSSNNFVDRLRNAVVDAVG